MNDCSCSVNHGTGGGNAKENAGCLSDAEYGDQCHKEDGWNDKDGLHGGVCVWIN